MQTAIIPHPAHNQSENRIIAYATQSASVIGQIFVGAGVIYVGLGVAAASVGLIPDRPGLAPFCLAALGVIMTTGPVMLMAGIVGAGVGAVHELVDYIQSYLRRPLHN